MLPDGPRHKAPVSLVPKLALFSFILSPSFYLFPSVLLSPSSSLFPLSLSLSSLFMSLCLCVYLSGLSLSLFLSCIVIKLTHNMEFSILANFKDVV